jgi:O-antigen ligase
MSFKNLLNKTKLWMKNPLAIAILIVIIFPPLGVVWFMCVGWFTLIRRLIKGTWFPKSSSTIFFLGIALCASVSLLSIQEMSSLFYIPVPILILGYYGVYLHVFDEIGEIKEAFNSYAVSLILGGLYIFLFSKAIIWFHINFSSPFNYLMGRALLGTPATARLYGSTFNPNFAAYLILVMIGLVLAYLLKAFKNHSYKLIVLLAVILGLGGFAIYDTGSRSAFIVMFVLILLALTRLNWKAGLAVIVMVSIGINSLVRFIPRKNIIDLSYDERVIIWKNSFKIFAAHPVFGVSPSGFSVLYTQLTNKYVPHPHDIFIAFLTEYGVVGEVVFLLFSGVLTGYFLKMVLVKTYRQLFCSEAFLLTLPIIFFTGLLDHPLFSPQVALPTVILVAFFHRYARQLGKS